MPQIKVEVDDAVFQFVDLDHWKTTAERLFRAVGLSAADVLCVDARGRICVTGKEFMEAKTDESYPIVAYPIPALRRFRTAARAAVLREEKEIDRADERIEKAYPLPRNRKNEPC